MAPRLCPLEDRDARGARGGDLRVVVVGGGRADDAVRALNILLAVADVDGDPAALKLFRRDGGIHIRAGDLHAHAPQHKAERPHRHAADSDQMAALAGDQILLNMLTGRIFHARFLRKIWIAHAREGAYNEN